MRQQRAALRGKAATALMAGFIGYLLGGWHPAAIQARSQASAAEAVAQRFPQTWTATPASYTRDTVPAAGVLDWTIVQAPAQARLALLDPQPMVPPHAAPADASPPIAGTPEPNPAPAPPQVAEAEVPAPASIDHGDDAAAPKRQSAAIASTRAEKARTPEAARRLANRPGFMLDDAQIASIKERLHLTPDQQQMWPAVEAALRNIAYERKQAAYRRRGAAEGADIDPASVQGLKSAAVPLIMSFNDEQKQEVRNLAHVMGLDQLAAQF